MKKAFLIFSLLCSAALVCAQHNMKDMPGMKMNKRAPRNGKKPEVENDKKDATQKVIYTCVMHPEVKMDKPGNCPKCGMKLIRKAVKGSIPSSDPQMQDTMPMQKDTMPYNRKMKDTVMKMPGNNKMDMDEKGEEKISEIEKQQVIIGKGKTVRYDLYVNDTIVNFTGKSKHAYAINGSIPAPTLFFTEGDTAEIYLHNMLKVRRNFPSLAWCYSTQPGGWSSLPDNSSYSARRNASIQICNCTKRNLLVSFAQQIAGTGRPIWGIDF